MSAATSMHEVRRRIAAQIFFLPCRRRQVVRPAGHDLLPRALLQRRRHFRPAMRQALSDVADAALVPPTMRPLTGAPERQRFPIQAANRRKRDLAHQLDDFRRTPFIEHLRNRTLLAPQRHGGLLFSSSPAAAGADGATSLVLAAASRPSLAKETPRLFRLQIKGEAERRQAQPAIGRALLEHGGDPSGPPAS